MGWMNMLTILHFVLICTTSVYFLGLFLFFIGLFFPNKKRQNRQYFVSIVIAVRNEEKNIANLLSDLMKQTYPQDFHEIIVVDDHSEDGTDKVVQGFIKRSSNIRLIHVSQTDKDLTPKKNALYQGIQNSRGEIILTTDGDCRVLSTWVETMISYFTPEVGMVVGFSQLGRRNEKQSLFQQLQAIDFLSLMAAAQGSSNLGWPLAASGQNLAYRREAFQQADGFSQIGHRISGDDVLLLQLIHKKTSLKIKFAPSDKCYNASLPERNFSSFLNQRKRWASNGSYQIKLNLIFFLFILTTFLLNLSLFAIFPIGFILSRVSVLPILCLIMKLIAEVCITTKGCRVYGRTDLLKVFPLWFILQIPYVVFIGLLGSVGTFTWKRRTHSPGRGGKS